MGHIIDRLGNSNYFRPALAAGLVIMLFFGAIPNNQNAMAQTTEDALLCTNPVFCPVGEIFPLGQLEHWDAHPPNCEVEHYHGYFGPFMISLTGAVFDEPFGDCGFLLDLLVFGEIISLETCTPGEVCRPAAGVCDRFEECGSDGFCPVDLYLERNDVTSPCAVDQNECTIDPFCDGSGPNCPAFVADVGATCGDGTSCTEDICDENAVCQTGIPKQEGETCGNQDNTLCDNPNTCDGAGNCQDNFADAGDFCIGNNVPSPFNCHASAACNGQGACIDQFKDEGTSCGIPVTSGDCDALDTCDAAGTCVDRKAFPGTACGSNADTECTDPDTCDGSGTCQPNHVVGFPTVSCGNDLCKQEICSNGVCVFDKNEPNDKVCRNSLDPACTEDDTCQGGVCVAGGPVDCSDGNICTSDICIPGPGPGSGCFNPPAFPVPPACVIDLCANPIGGGGPVDCNDNNICTTDSCNPATGACTNTPTTSLCDDSDSCTANDMCDSSGQCVGNSDPVCLVIEPSPDNESYNLNYACEDDNEVSITDATFTRDGVPLEPSDLSFYCPPGIVFTGLEFNEIPNDFSAEVTINGVEGSCVIETGDDITSISFDLNEGGEVECFRGEGSAAILTLSPPDDMPVNMAVGGTFIPIDSTALLVGYVQTNLAWIIPLLMITAALGFMQFRRK